MQNRTNKSENIFKSILSGGLTGAIEMTITYPTEYIKIMMQLNKEFSKKGTIACAKETYQKFGFFGFYRGLSALLIFSIPKTGVRFGANEYLKNNIFTQRGYRIHTFMSGLGSGVAEAVLVVTIAETIKVKLIHDILSEQQKFKGVFQGIYSIYKEKGFSGIYKGVIPTILKQGSNQAIRFLVYEDTKQFLQDQASFLPKSLILLMSGGIAGGVSVLANTPMDVIKTQMQGLKADKYKGTLDCINQTFNKEGIRGFYKGATPRLTKVILEVSLTFTLYDYISQGINQLFQKKI